MKRRRAACDLHSAYAQRPWRSRTPGSQPPSSNASIAPHASASAARCNAASPDASLTSCHPRGTTRETRSEAPPPLPPPPSPRHRPSRRARSDGALPLNYPREMAPSPCPASWENPLAGKTALRQRMMPTHRDRSPSPKPAPCTRASAPSDSDDRKTREPCEPEDRPSVDSLRGRREI